jgi:hypothetical protein
MKPILGKEHVNVSKAISGHIYIYEPFSANKKESYIRHCEQNFLFVNL